eukprot:GSA120T00005468001.1
MAFSTRRELKKTEQAARKLGKSFRGAELLAKRRTYMVPESDAFLTPNANDGRRYMYLPALFSKPKEPEEVKKKGFMSGVSLFRKKPAVVEGPKAIATPKATTLVFNEEEDLDSGIVRPPVPMSQLTQKPFRVLEIGRVNPRRVHVQTTVGDREVRGWISWKTRGQVPLLVNEDQVKHFVPDFEKEADVEGAESGGTKTTGDDVATKGSTSASTTGTAGSAAGTSPAVAPTPVVPPPPAANSEEQMMVNENDVERMDEEHYNRVRAMHDWLQLARRVRHAYQEKLYTASNSGKKERAVELEHYAERMYVNRLRSPRDSLYEVENPELPKPKAEAVPEEEPKNPGQPEVKDAESSSAAAAPSKGSSWGSWFTKRAAAAAAVVAKVVTESLNHMFPPLPPEVLTKEWDGFLYEGDVVEVTKFHTHRGHQGPPPGYEGAVVERLARIDHGTDEVFQIAFQNGERWLAPKKLLGKVSGEYGFANSNPRLFATTFDRYKFNLAHEGDEDPMPITERTAPEDVGNDSRMTARNEFRRFLRHRGFEAAEYQRDEQTGLWVQRFPSEEASLTEQANSDSTLFHPSSQEEELLAGHSGLGTSLDNRILLAKPGTLPDGFQAIASSKELGSRSNEVTVNYRVPSLGKLPPIPRQAAPVMPETTSFYAHDNRRRSVRINRSPADFFSDGKAAAENVSSRVGADTRRRGRIRPREDASFSFAPPAKVKIRTSFQDVLRTPWTSEEQPEFKPFREVLEEDETG